MEMLPWPSPGLPPPPPPPFSSAPHLKHFSVLGFIDKNPKGEKENVHGCINQKEKDVSTCSFLSLCMHPFSRLGFFLFRVDSVLIRTN